MHSYKWCIVTGNLVHYLTMNYPSLLGDSEVISVAAGHHLEILEAQLGPRYTPEAAICILS